MPSSRKITIEDEPESKTCSIVERQALDQYRAKLARELENFEPIKVEEISLQELEKPEFQMRNFGSHSEFPNTKVIEEDALIQKLNQDMFIQKSRSRKMEQISIKKPTFNELSDSKPVEKSI